MRTPKTYPFVITLLSAWKAAGHPVGVDTHLQIVELLKKLPADTEPGRLKTLIAPILTSDPQKQLEFYTLFDRLPKIEPPLRLDNLLIPLVFIGLLGIIIYFIFKKTDRLPIEYTNEIINIDLNDPKGVYCPDTLGTEMRQFSFLAVDTTKKSEHLRIIPTSKCFEYQGISVGRDTIYLRIVYKNLGRDITGRSGANASITLNRRVIFNIDSRNTDTTTFDLDTLAYKPYQHNPSIESLRAEHIPIFSLKYAYFDWQKLAILVGIFLFLLQAGFLRNLIQYRQQKRASDQPEQLDTQAADLKRKPNDKPPFTWQLRIPNAGRIQTGEDFVAIVQQLRRRSESDQNVFDSQRTIRATINNGGRIVFRYRQPTQANEYLLLIDTLTVNDHRAQLFNFIYQEFSNNEILIERFYYDGDLRLCWNEQHPKGLSIRELQYKFSNHRLLIVGTGDRLINPLNGQLERWTNIFEQWRNRALISTRPINQWGEEEAQLGSKFYLVPATLRGLADLVQERDAVEVVNFQKWKKSPDELAIPLRLPAKLSPAAVFANLEAEYIDYPKGQPDDRMLQWIAACAISPVLHWDATLFFGEQIDNNVNNSLLTVENLMRLNRLNWFIEGKMPDSVRTHLLDWLKKEHLEQLVLLRSAWKHLLEQNLQQFQERSLVQNQTPFEQTVAYDQLRMTIVVNELALDDLHQKLLPQQRQQLERELHDLSTITSPDVVALELLKQLDAKEEQMETSAVSEAAKEDFPGLLSGWKWQLPLLMIGFLSILGYNDKNVAACKNSSVSLNGNTYCINSPQDSLTYLEHLFCDTSYNREIVIIIFSDISGSIKIDSPKPQEGVLSLIRALSLSQPTPIYIDEKKVGLDSILKITKNYLIKNNDEVLLKKGIDLIRKNKLDSTSFYENIAISYWNKGAKLYNAGLKDSACIYFNKLAYWKWSDLSLSYDERNLVNSVCQINLPSTLSNNKPSNIFLFRNLPESVYVSETPNIEPYLEFNPSMLKALYEQAQYLRRSDVENYPVTGISKVEMLRTVEMIQDIQILQSSTLFENFEFYKVKTSFVNDRVRITGYFTPIIEASRKRTNEYSVPLLRRPENVPSPASIVAGALEGKGLELAWLRSKKDLANSQLQGSCWVKYPDGSREHFGFGGSVKGNGGKYVFFTKVDDNQLGAGFFPLTAGYSVAVDPRYIPIGATLLAELPDMDPSGKINGYNYRILFAQDRGGAILTTKRMDIYCGIGEEGLKEARKINGYGRLWLMLPK